MVGSSLMEVLDPCSVSHVSFAVSNSKLFDWSCLSVSMFQSFKVSNTVLLLTTGSGIQGVCVVPIHARGNNVGYRYLINKNI